MQLSIGIIAIDFPIAVCGISKVVTLVNAPFKKNIFDDGEVYFSITYNPGREGEGLTSDQLNSIIMGEQAAPAA